MMQRVAWWIDFINGSQTVCYQWHLKHPMLVRKMMFMRWMFCYHDKLSKKWFNYPPLIIVCKFTNFGKANFTKYISAQHICTLWGVLYYFFLKSLQLVDIAVSVCSEDYMHYIICVYSRTSPSVINLVICVCRSQRWT